MLRVSKDSRHSPEKVLNEAARFFGPDGQGLQVKDRCEGSSILLEGGGGYVTVTVCPKGKGAEVTLETREWEQSVQQFLGKI